MKLRYRSLLASEVLFTATVLFLSGCASSGSVASPSAGGEPQDRNTSGTDDTPRDDLTNEQVLEWQRYEKVGDSTLRVFFTAGSDACYATRAIIEQTDTTIRLATVEGTIPNAPAQCTLVGREASLVVETTRPIGDREVVPLLHPELR